LGSIGGTLSEGTHIEAREAEAGRLTKDGPGRYGLSVEPEGHLGQDDGHDAGQVRLDHKVADLPLQVEVGGHHHVFSCGQRFRRHRSGEGAVNQHRAMGNTRYR